MNNQVEYKGYIGEVTVDMEAGLIHGLVVNIENDILTFRGETPAKAEEDFRSLIDEYIGDCEASGQNPEQPRLIAIATSSS